MINWLKDAIFYEIYPQSFMDTNGDGIGDFQGIIDKLDYVKSLGCTAIWLNPCFDSPFADAGYDVRDYKKAAPRYGTNEDLCRLFEEAHKRDMHILLDLVAGHTSEQHEWFQKSRLDDQNEYAHRYIWTDGWFTSTEGLKQVAGMAPRNGVYIVNFFHTQPALNYGFLNPKEPWQKGIDDPDCVATREALWDVMDFWLSKGCDGFRVDMADSLVKNDDENKSGTCRIWSEIRKKLDAKYPDAAMVAEWNNPVQALNAGFHMDFMLDWSGNGYNYLLRDERNPDIGPVFRKTSTRSICDFLNDYLPKYEKIKNVGKYCLITGNHDTARASHFLKDDELRLAYAFLLTMPGAPYIYYGDEIGMRYLENLPSKEGGYTRTGTRTPMQWNSEANRGFSTADKDRLYLPVDESDDAPTVESQLNVKGSMIEHVKSLTALRHSEEDLNDDSNLEFIYARAYSRIFAYRRGNLLIVCNPDEKAHSIDIEDLPITVDEKESLLQGIQMVYNYGDSWLKDEKIVAEGVSLGVYRIE